MTKHVNRMTQTEFFKLCQALQPVILAADNTLEGLATVAAADLGFSVTRANVRSALETLGKAIPGAPKSDTQKLAILGQAILNLYQQLKETPPKELLEITK